MSTSTASDGSLTPSELVSLAVKNGLSAIALTDHDTVSGIDEALAAAGAVNAKAAGEIEVIPGIEISCIYEEKELHILGLFIDHHSRSLACFLEAAAARRKERNRKILEAVSKGRVRSLAGRIFCPAIRKQPLPGRTLQERF